MDGPSARIFVVAAGLMGAGGVALSAAAAHGGGGPFAGTVSTMMLVHAPAFLTVGLSPAGRRNRLLLAATWVLLAALALFCTDLAVRGLGWARLFPMAAPIGGSGMILGWLGIAISTVAMHRRSQEG